MTRWRARRRRPPIGPPLDEHGHYPDGAGEYEMWHLAAWVPAGRAAAVAELLAGQGVEVYRMWPSGEWLTGSPGEVPRG